MAESTIVSGSAWKTGMQSSNQTFYAVNSGRWWTFQVGATASTITSYYWSGSAWVASTSLTDATWTPGSNNDWCAAYLNIASTDVVYLVAYSGYVIRAVISGTAVSYGTRVQFAAINTGTEPNGVAAAFDSSNKLWIAYDDAGDAYYVVSSTAETGSSGITGYSGTYSAWPSYSNYVHSHVLLPISTGMLLLSDDSQSPTTGVNYNYITAPGNVTPSEVFATAVTMQPEDWAACKVSDSDVHCVRITGSNTFEHRRWNGTSWNAGQTIPTQAVLAGANINLVSDGTNVWLICLSSAAGNPVVYVEWSGGAWGSWQTLESTGATRDGVVSSPQVASNTIQVVWSEGAGPYTIAGEQLSLGSSGTAYNQTVIDTTSGTDSSVWNASKYLADWVSQLDAWVKTVLHRLLDATSGTDSVQKSVVRDLFDALSSQDVLTRLARRVVMDDALSSQDVLTRRATHVSSDQVSLSDALARVSARTFLDWLSATDLVSPSTLTGAQFYSRTVLDSWSALDLVRNLVIARLPDALSAVDGQSTVIQHLLASPLTLLDAYSRVSYKQVAATLSSGDANTFSLLDSLHSQLLTGGSVFSQTLSDDLSLLDALLRDVRHYDADTFAQLDRITLSWYARLLLTDVLSGTDHTGKQLGRIWYDASSLSDLVYHARDFYLSDSIFLADQLKRSLAKHALDAYSALDLVARASSMTLDEALSALDHVTVARVLLQSVLDTLGLSDVLVTALGTPSGRLSIAVVTSLLASSLGVSISLINQIDASTSLSAGLSISASIL